MISNAEVDAHVGRMGELRPFAAGRRDELIVRDTLRRVKMETGVEPAGDYRYFLGRYGRTSCRPMQRVFIKGWPHSFVLLACFLGPDPTVSVSILKELRNLYDEYEGARPSGLVPFARDNADCVFAFAPPKPGATEPRVVFVDIRWTTIPLEEVNRRQEVLSREGVRSYSMSKEAILISWEMLHPDTIDHEPGWGNIYDVAATFGDFLAGLVVDA